jgi:DNA helicase-2/ATP-dependent DNA helicase PcrA
MDPDELLADLTAPQRAAASTLSGPVGIIAGAGSGKTRVISRRLAYAVATRTIDPRRVLILTFTERAAGEMEGRIRRLRLPDVTARTFHSAAYLQLRHFWPSIGADRPLPMVVRSKVPSIARALARETGRLRFIPARDFADAIEWAKVHRIRPERLALEAGRHERELPADPDDVVRIWQIYEAGKKRDGAVDFEDMLELVLQLLETDPDAAEAVRRRYTWFSVDEYQDTNPLQEALLSVWLGDNRDLCVVGDPDQAIFSFTGATPEYLLSFRRRFPTARIFDLSDNFRSTPGVVEVANRLLAAVGRPRRLRSTRSAGPEPVVRRFPTDVDEADAVVQQIRTWQANGIELRQVAVLVRLNAQIAEWEEVLRLAGVPFSVRGERFFHRADVRRALSVLRHLPDDIGQGSGALLSILVAEVWGKEFGYQRDESQSTDAARERQAALDELLVVADAVEASSATASVDDLLAELDRRSADEETPIGNGVTLSTIHRAKGLEWEAVLLPSWEEGLLPYRSALGKPREIAEERRLAYVAVTRARTHLWIGFAEERPGPRGTPVRRVPSRFFTDIEGKPRERTAARPTRVRNAGNKPVSAGAPRAGGPHPADTASPADEALFQALRAWRREASAAAGLSAWIVASDALLRAIAAARPRTTDDLQPIPGMGPKRIESHGQAILAMVRRVGEGVDSIVDPPTEADSRQALRDTEGGQGDDLGQPQGIPDELIGGGPRRDATVRRPDGNAAEDVFQALRSWRLEICRSAGVSPFVVAHNSLLRSIASANPASLGELSAVKGMGPKKMETYGEAILRAIAGAAE